MSAPELEDYKVLQERLNYFFNNLEKLVRAVTHRSYSQTEENYEILEFIGDAVIDLVVADLLVARFPKASEGELSKRRAAIVNTDSLAALAKRLDLAPFIRLGRGELASGGVDRPALLADVVEALIGAVYQDGGFENARKVVCSLVDMSVVETAPRDPKTELQELLHAMGEDVPLYELESTSGPEHAPVFISQVTIRGEISGRGEGSTKKSSQQQAAAQALQMLRSQSKLKGTTE